MIIGILVAMVGVALLIPGQRSNTFLLAHHINPNHAHVAGGGLVILGVVFMVIAQAWRNR